MTATHNMVSGLRSLAASVAQGFLHITHSGFALLGVAVAIIVITLTARPDLRQAGEARLVDWLQARQETLAIAADDLQEPSERTLAVNPKELPQEQARVAYWLSKKYRVAPEPLGLLVAEAYEIGSRAKLDPTLILAVMAIESRFNPFAQSPVGAQGLMQVMTRVHTDKYEALGGHLAAFDPVSNLRVGVKVLQECIARAGSVQGGLAYYVGATDPQNDGGYAEKVLAEHYRLRQVASTGRAVPTSQPVAPATLATQAPAKAVPAAASPEQGASATGLGEKVALLTATDL